MAGDDSLTIGQRVARLRAVLAGILAAPPETMLDVKRQLARELGFEPTPQALQGVSALREIKDLKGREIGTRSLILHLAVAWSSQETWHAEETEPSRLRRAVSSIPLVLALSESVEKAFDATIEKVNRLERDAVGRLHASLHVPDKHFFAALVVIPEVARLAEAAGHGTLAEAAPSLTSEERAAIAAASASGPSDAPRPDRVLVDAIALRTLIERDLAAFEALAASEDDAAAAGTRRDVRRRLQSQRMAHEIVSERIEATRSERFARTRAADRAIDHARRRLFAAYLAASTALAGQPEDAEDDLRARILEAEREAAAIDADHAARTELLADATARAAASARVEPQHSPDLRTLERERRRTRVLVGIAATLLPCALTANILFYGNGARALSTSPDFLASAMPVREIVPIGKALYSQVSTLLWEDLTEPERRDKVKALGKLALQRGYRVVLVVDDSRRERARWSLTDGTELAEDRGPN